MKKIELFVAMLFVFFAIISLFSAIVFYAWWNLVIAAICAAMAWAFVKDIQNAPEWDEEEE